MGSKIHLWSFHVTVDCDRILIFYQEIVLRNLIKILCFASNFNGSLTYVERNVLYYLRAVYSPDACVLMFYAIGFSFSLDVCLCVVIVELFTAVVKASFHLNLIE